MFRFLTITMAVCFLFIQDAQAAVASNLREIQLEEELLRVSWREHDTQAFDEYILLLFF